MTYKVTECLRVIQNLFAEPKYSKMSITMEAWIKLMSYIHLVGNNEITGLGRIKDNTIIDFKIPKQEVTGTTADATDEDMIALLREIPIEEIDEWELDWHSHVDMQVFMSGTDEDNYELMSMARGNKQFPLLVVNKSGEVCFKNFIHKGKITDIELTLLKKELTDKEIEKIYNECKEDVVNKVSEKPKPVYKPTQQSWYENYIKKVNKNKDEITDAEYTIEKKKNKYSLGENKYYCKSCGVELITPDEIDNGYCEDCMMFGYADNRYRYGWK